MAKEHYTVAATRTFNRALTLTTPDPYVTRAPEELGLLLEAVGSAANECGFLAEYEKTRKELTVHEPRGERRVVAAVRGTGVTVSDPGGKLERRRLSFELDYTLEVLTSLDGSNAAEVLTRVIIEQLSALEDAADE